MGNCLVIQDRNKEIKIMSMDVDGEILKLPTTSTLNGISSSDDALPAAADMADLAAGAVVRVKLVVSKQELKKMLLHNDAAISLNDMVSLMQKQAEADDELQQQQQESCGVWQPTLQSIPEGSVF
uniref:Uncharacterized protein n=1 Tax=Oryza punctata TaxID=4537 RepID=A0A0E0MJR0_ORYPU